MGVATRGGILVLAALAAAGCGSNDQQSNDQADYKVEASATFPKDQTLAQTSQLRIKVTNRDTRTLPNVAVTVTGFNYELKDPNHPNLPDPSVSDPSRPRFVVDRSPIEFQTPKPGKDSSLVDKEVAVPYGRQTAYVGTYSLGQLPPGRTTLFRWDVTAVKSGPYDIRWTVDAGTARNQNAVNAGSTTPASGSFSGTVSGKPAEATIGKDGKSVVTKGQGTTKY